MTEEITRDGLTRTVRNKHGEEESIYTLYHPHGFPVEVRSSDRAEILVGRGYSRSKPQHGKSANVPSTTQHNESGFQSSDYTVDQVLDHVGDDIGLATQALESEESRGDRARRTLVEALTTIVEGGI